MKTPEQKAQAVVDAITALVDAQITEREIEDSIDQRGYAREERELVDALIALISPIQPVDQ